MTPHDKVLPECDQIHQQFKDHVKEAEGHKQMLFTHEANIKTIFNILDDIKKLRAAIIGSSVGLIVAIFTASATVAVTWGTTAEKVRSLEEWRNGFYKYTATAGKVEAAEIKEAK